MLAKFETEEERALAHAKWACDELLNRLRKYHGEAQPAPPKPVSKFLTPAEAAAGAGYTTTTIRRWCRIHGIGTRRGGGWLVFRDRLDAYLETINAKPQEAYESMLRQELERKKAASRHESLFKQILASVCLEWMVTRDDIMSPRKLGHIVRARQAAIYLTDSLIKNWTLMRIGMYFQRDHTTVIHAINSVRDLRESNEELDKKLSRIEAELRPVETAA
jgi:hypothetical protein